MTLARARTQAARPWGHYALESLEVILRIEANGKFLRNLNFILFFQLHGHSDITDSSTTLTFTFSGLSFFL